MKSRDVENEGKDANVCGRPRYKDMISMNYRR